MTDNPKEENHSGSQQGASDQTCNPCTKSVHSTQETQSVKEKWWRKPEHIIQVFILLFVASYTVLTYCLLLTSRDTEWRQLRAYVGVLDHQIQNVAAKSAPHVQVMIKNFGTTPAADVIYWIFSKLDNYPTPVDLPVQSFGTNKAILFPTDGFTATFDIPTLGENDMAGLNASRWLYVYGEVNYWDAFKNGRCTRFRLMYGGPLLKIGRMAIAGDGNEIDKNCRP